MPDTRVDNELTIKTGLKHVHSKKTLIQIERRVTGQNFFKIKIAFPELSVKLPNTSQALNCEILQKQNLIIFDKLVS